jgi:hypothetical protein
MLVIVTYWHIAFLSAPLPLTIATVGMKALFDLGISGRGAGAKTILLTNRNRKFRVNVR